MAGLLRNRLRPFQVNNARRRIALRSLGANLLVALPLVASTGFVALVWHDARAGARQSGVVDVALQVGDALPEALIINAQGDAIPIHSLVEDAPTLLVVVDPACPHCHTELDALTRIAGEVAEVPARRVAVISVGAREGTSSLRQRYATLSIYGDEGGAFAQAIGLQAVPVQLLVSGSGAVSAVEVGWLGESHLRALLDLPARQLTASRGR